MGLTALGFGDYPEPIAPVRRPEKRVADAERAIGFDRQRVRSASPQGVGTDELIRQRG